MNLEIYQQLCAESKILWTQHCLQRMQERDISRADVKNGIATGEIIEDYPDDFPNPSCLIFGYNVNGRILHIVAGCDNINIYIITAYYPDTKKFESIHNKLCLLHHLAKSSSTNFPSLKSKLYVITGNVIIHSFLISATTSMNTFSCSIISSIWSIAIVPSGKITSMSLVPR